MVELIYFLALLISVLLANRSHERIVITPNGTKVKPASWGMLFSAFIPLWAFLCFSSPSLDYDNYIRIIDFVSWQNPYAGTSEIGFNYLIVIIKSLVSEKADIVIFCIRTLSLLVVFLSLYRLHKQVNLGYSIFIYGTTVFLFSTYALSQIAAASLELMAFSFIYTSDKRKIKIWGYVVAIIGAQLHTSAYLALPVLLVIDYSLRKPKEFQAIKWFYFIGAFVAFILLSMIIGYIESNFQEFQYGEYFEDTQSGLGFRVYIEYAALFIMYFLLPVESVSLRFRNTLYIFLVTTFFITIVSYTTSVGARMHTIFMAQNVALLPQLLKNRKCLKNKQTLILVLIALYLSVEILLSFNSEFYGGNRLADSKLFNPFTGKIINF